eukprot:gene17083-23378_t
MDDEFRIKVCQIAEFIYAPAGTTLFSEGSNPDFLYVILQGRINLSSVYGSIQETGVMSAGHAEKKRTYTATAVDRSELLIVSRVGYNRLLRVQLQAGTIARTELLKTISVLGTKNYATGVAIHCKDEQYYSGRECKLVYHAPDEGLRLPEDKYLNSYGLFDPDATGQADGHEEERPVREKLEGKRNAAAGGKEEAEGQALARGGSPSKKEKSKKSIGSHRSDTVLNVARVGRGDILNGHLLICKKTIFHVVAVSQVKVLSMELDVVESCFGKEAMNGLKDLVSGGTLDCTAN